MTRCARGRTQLTRLSVGGVVTALLAIVSTLEFPVLVAVGDNVLTAVVGLTIAVVGLTIAVVGLGISLFAVAFDSLLFLFVLGGLLLFVLHHG